MRWHGKGTYTTEGVGGGQRLLQGRCKSDLPFYTPLIEEKILWSWLTVGQSVDPSRSYSGIVASTHAIFSVRGRCRAEKQKNLAKNWKKQVRSHVTWNNHTDHVLNFQLKHNTSFLLLLPASTLCVLISYIFGLWWPMHSLKGWQNLQSLIVILLIVMATLQCVAACKATFNDHPSINKHKRTCKHVLELHEKCHTCRFESTPPLNHSRLSVSALSDRKIRLQVRY